MEGCTSAHEGANACRAVSLDLPGRQRTTKAQRGVQVQRFRGDDGELAPELDGGHGRAETGFEQVPPRRPGERRCRWRRGAPTRGRAGRQEDQPKCTPAARHHLLLRPTRRSNLHFRAGRCKPRSPRGEDPIRAECVACGQRQRRRSGGGRRAFRQATGSGLVDEKRRPRAKRTLTARLRAERFEQSMGCRLAEAGAH